MGGKQARHGEQKRGNESGRGLLREVILKGNALQLKSTVLADHTG